MGNRRVKPTNIIELLFYLLGRRKHYRVEGRSMLPNFRPGDDLLGRPVHTSQIHKCITAEDIVVVFDRERQQTMIKRVTQVKPDHLEVQGDNVAESAQIADVEFKNVIAKVTSKLRS